MAAAGGRVTRRGRNVQQSGAAREIVVAMRDSGASLREIAQHLESLGIKTATEKRWHSSTVRSILNSDRLDKAASRAAEARRRAIAAREISTEYGNVFARAGEAAVLAKTSHTPVVTAQGRIVEVAGQGRLAAVEADKALKAAAAQVAFIKDKFLQPLKTAAETIKADAAKAKENAKKAVAKARRLDGEAREASKTLSGAVADAARSIWTEDSWNAIAKARNDSDMANRLAAQAHTESEHARKRASAVELEARKWEKVITMVERALERAVAVRSAARSSKKLTVETTDMAEQAATAASLAVAAVKRIIEAHEAVRPFPD